MRVGTHEIHEIDRRSLIEHMLGEMEGAKAQVEHEHALPGSGEEVVRIDRLHVPGSVEEVSLTLESGIITGLAGQVGSGTSTVLRALGGLVPNASGTIEVGGTKVLLNTPRRAAAAGVLYIPNDRQREGLFLGQTVERNLTVTRLRRLSRLGVLLRRRVQRSARELATMASVPLDRLGSPAQSLSGGNQQKVLLGRALQLEGTALLALDEPTRGVDVGGRAEIHNLVREAARKGTAVIFSSTELDEVLDLADVVVTIFAGRIVSVVPRAEASASAILADMTTSQSATGRSGVVSGPMTAAMGRFGLERRAIRLADIALAIWIAMLAAVTVYGATTTTGFLTWSNFKAILTAAAFVGIIAVGLTVIVLSGNLFSLALGQTAAISAMVFLYALRFDLGRRDRPDAAARPRDRRRSGVRGRRLGSEPDHHHDRRRGPDGGHGGVALARAEHRPARRRDELGAPREPGSGPARSRLRLHRRHDRAGGGDATDAVRAPDLPPRREPRRRPGGRAADHAADGRRLRDRVALHRGLGDPDRRDERERVAAPRPGATPTTRSPPLSSAATP